MRAARALGFAALLALLADIGPVLAQAAARPPAAGRASECAQLPGGRAPVLKIAGLATGLSPRDLDLVYFGKALAELSDEDFVQIATLSKRCGTGEGILPEEKQQAFQSVVQAAQQIRRTSLDKVKRQMTDITAMPVARDKLLRLNGMSESLPLLEATLTKGDVKSTADWIAKQMQAVYDATPKGEATSTKPMASPQLQVQATSTLVQSPAAPNRRRVPGGEED
jgi:hypothetical protein